MSLDRKRTDRESWNAELLDGAPEADLEALAAWVLETPGRRIVVDCTPSDRLDDFHRTLLAGGVRGREREQEPFAGQQETWRSLRDAAEAGGAGLYIESTVGAGLPVIRTLESLLATGDRLLSVEGLFSGTLGFLTYRLRQGVSFSAALREAHDLGYTEPDPREDLSGNDVLRKLLILARLAGGEIEADEVELEPLLPEGDWWQLDLDAFWNRLPDIDEEIAARVAGAAEASKALTFLARWDSGGARVGVAEVGGTFSRGEPVDVLDPDGKAFARGLAAVSADELRAITGVRSDDHPEGTPEEVIHRDALVLLA